MLTPSNPTYTEGDIDVVTRTVWGEARGESDLGKCAVAWVIRNRLVSGITWWGRTYSNICKARQQFSCWNSNDPNYPYLSGQKLIPASTFTACKAAVMAALDGSLSDPTMGATHYHAVGITPYWAPTAKRTAIIGNHVFYKDVK